MQFNPNLILSEQEYRSIMGYKDGIPIGIVTDHPTEPFKKLMELWVSRIDDRMDQVKEGSEIYEELKKNEALLIKNTLLFLKILTKRILLFFTSILHLIYL